MDAKMQLIEMSPETLIELIAQKLQSLLEEIKKSILQCGEKELLTPKEVCDLLGIDDSTLWHWRNRGIVQAYGKGGRRYYKRSEIIGSLIPMKPNKKVTLKNAA